MKGERADNQLRMKTVNRKLSKIEGGYIYLERHGGKFYLHILLKVRGALGVASYDERVRRIYFFQKEFLIKVNIRSKIFSLRNKGAGLKFRKVKHKFLTSSKSACHCSLFTELFNPVYEFTKFDTWIELGVTESNILLS